MGERERAIDGRSWAEFCDRLRDAGDAILRGPADPLTRAEGFRYVSRVTRAALETFVEYSDPLAPTLRRVVHETVKMGADNPDNVYLHARIDGRRRYRLRGTRGTVHTLTFSTQRGHYGQGAGMPPTGHLDASDLKVDAEGRFEIELGVSPPESAASHLPMTEETGSLIVRQTRIHPGETLAELELERLGPAEDRAPLDPAELDDALSQSGRLVAGATLLFASWADGFTAHTNQLPRFDQDLSNAMGGVPDIAYYHSYWRLAPEEALLVEFAPAPCEYWNFQLDNHWMESLDYRYFTIHTNSGRAVKSADGRYRLVVAHTDPGVPNWIQTAGHGFGTMCFRWVKPQGEPKSPETRVVPVASLRDGVAS